MNETQITHIVDTYRKFNEDKLQPGIVEDRFSYVATFEEIQENDFNLNIPRYVDTFEEEAEVDIDAVQKEIDALEIDLAKVQKEMKNYLIELAK
jgi:type I restriction enzyme M protein